MASEDSVRYLGETDGTPALQRINKRKISENKRFVLHLPRGHPVHHPSGAVTTYAQPRFVRLSQALPE